MIATQNSVHNHQHFGSVDETRESTGCMAFVCPLCREDLERLVSAYRCVACARTYPLHYGIPDFRVFPDSYLGFEEDRERTESILAVLDRYDLHSLLEYYWNLSSCTPTALQRKFIRSAMRSERKARLVNRTLTDHTFDEPVSPERVLEIGCGTGGFLAASLEQGQQVVGVDIAMRWLHLSRRRFLDKGLPSPPLVCCCAEFLPFPANTFDLTVMSSTLEFVSSQRQVLSECARTLRADGSLMINTVNRYSIVAGRRGNSRRASVWSVGQRRRTRLGKPC